jgi:hypothetical protein
MGDEQVCADRTAARERDAKLPRAGAAVKDEERPVIGARLDAGRVAAVASGLRPGRGDRPADAPEADAD